MGFLLESCERKGADTILHDCFSVQTASHKFQHNISKDGKYLTKKKTLFFLDILSGSLATDLIFHSKKRGEVKKGVAKSLAVLC